MTQEEKSPRDWRRGLSIACLIACLVLVGVAVWLVVYHCDKCSPEDRLMLLVGYGTLILVFFYGFMVLLDIAVGRIDLSRLLSETGGPEGKSCHASMSRFQLLIFTFVIGLSLFMITAAHKEFPTKIPPEILTLLGISASTYAVSKGIQASTEPKPGADGQASDGGDGGTITSTTQDPDTGTVTTREHNPTTGQTVTKVHNPTTGTTETTVHTPTTIKTTTTVVPPPPPVTPPTPPTDSLGNPRV